MLIAQGYKGDCEYDTNWWLLKRTTEDELLCYLARRRQIRTRIDWYVLCRDFEHDDVVREWYLGPVY